MDRSTSFVYRFGEFELAPDEKRLSRGANEVHLRPKTFEVLAFLVGNRERLVDRQSLFEAVWPEVQVTDNALTRCIKEIRNALDDDAKDPTYVQTIPKRGYKFIARVSAEGGSEVVSSPPRLESIAVLPFADMSEARDQEYFCDGITEDILTALSRLDALRVVARTSSFAFKGKTEDVREVGRRLGVDVLLEGSVRRDGERLRITAQLIDAGNGYHIWSERYDREIRDVFAVQDDISQAIVEKLRLQLLREEHGLLARRHTDDLEAYQLFLKGRYFLNRRHEGDFSRALASFHESLGRDPDYVLPHIAMANTFTILGVWGFVPPAEAFQNVKASATRALEIDDTMAEAHLSLALHAFVYQRDREEADRRFDLAFRSNLQNPLGNAWYGLRLLDHGRDEDAIAQMRKALRMDPLSPMIHTVAAAGHLSGGRLDEAKRLLEQSLELDDSLPISHHWLGWCFAMVGDDDAAEPELKKAADAGFSSSMGALGLVLARRGQQSAAREILAKLDELSRHRYVPRFPSALVHVGLGELDRSFALFDEALEAREPTVVLSLVGKFSAGVLPELWIEEARRRL